MQRKNILIVCSMDKSLISFRGDFIQDLISEGYTVYTASPNLSSTVADKLKMFGAIPLEYDLTRAGISPLGDIQSIKQLRQLMMDHKIDLVFPYTIKPVIYASMAANKLDIPVISMITGLGFSFTGISTKARILQKVAEFLYKKSIRKNRMVIFQNRDDEELFRKLGILTKEQKTDIVNGSGVNLNQYAHRINDKTGDDIKFVFVARLIREKGINLFLNAAQNLKPVFPNAEFHVIGSPDQSPSSIKEEEIHELDHKGVIKYHGSVNNVPELLYQSDIFVLPTYYREGVPRSILEALSVGLPIITTDTPGCRETVLNNTNGFLIQPNCQEELTSAMCFFLENKDKIKEMGMESWKMAQNKFNVSIINKKLINLINQTLA